MDEHRDRGWAPVVLGVVRRPTLWSTAVVQVVRLAPPGWWRRPPFLPRPPAHYVAFRQVTATGRSTGAPDARDVVAWLAWCREWRHGRV